MHSRGQTSIEYLILVAGAILLALVVGYIVFSGTYGTYQDLNKMAGG